MLLRRSRPRLLSLREPEWVEQGRALGAPAAVHEGARWTRQACLVTSVVLMACMGGKGPSDAGGPEAVATVSVAPSTLNLTVGQEEELVATAQDAAGNVLTGREVTWATSASAVATVNGSGLVTGAGAGAAAISATCEGKRGTASVTVANESSGGTVLFQEGFEDENFASRGWYDNTSMTTTASEVKTGDRALEIHFPAGATTPTFGDAGRHLFAETASVFLSFWVKYSANWIGSGHSYHPHEFYFLTTEDDAYVGPAFTHLTTYVEDNYDNGGVPQLSMQDGKNIDQSKIGVDLTGITENRAAAGCNGSVNGNEDCYLYQGGVYTNEVVWRAAQPAFLPDPGPGYKNDWHFVEAYFQLNTIVNGVGQTDGVARYWVDGQLVIDQTHVLFRTGVHGAMRFNQFLIAPYIGDGSPTDQTMWIDDLTVATGRP